MILTGSRKSHSGLNDDVRSYAFTFFVRVHSGRDDYSLSYLEDGDGHLIQYSVSGRNND